MTSIFLTGATGYIGSYVAHELLERYPQTRLHVLVRARTQDEAAQRLWKAWQLHMPFGRFSEHLSQRIRIYLGDISQVRLGMEATEYTHLTKSIQSVIHCAASLNRKSEKACLNTNLKGTLHVILAAQAAHAHHGLVRFSDISTVAVAGHHQDDFLVENAMIDWQRSDYDPYARTKKFCEHMVHEMLPDVSKIIFRPSIVLGDSRFPQTTQFDMVRAFVWLSSLPILPFDPEWRLDIVNVDFVAAAIAQLHMKDGPVLESYNLSSGSESHTFREIAEALSLASGKRPPRFVPLLEWPTRLMVAALANSPQSLGFSKAFSLLKVFWPYLTFNTVFDNSRVVSEMGTKPVPFANYAKGLRDFAVHGRFTYRYQAWPTTPNTQSKVA